MTIRFLKIFSFSVFVFVATFLYSHTVFAEKITTFESAITVRTDATISVIEKINYDFETGSRHGIFRTIPFENSDGSEILVKNVSVKDEKGNDYTFTKTSNNNITIKIGDPNKTISGRHTYIISYDVQNALVSFLDFDELYWNITGNDWQVPMDQVSTTISFEKIKNEQIKQFSCYKGIQGSIDQCELRNENGILQTTVTNLSPGQGLTVAVGIEKGAISGISRIGGQTQEPRHIYPIFKIISIVMSAFAVIGAAWYRFFVIADPRSRNPVVAWYEPPAGLAPIAIGTLIDKRVDSADLTAQIISLAERGYVTISRIEKTTLKIFHDVDYAFEVVKDVKSLSFVGDLQTLEMLFKTKTPSVGTVVRISEIKDRDLAPFFFKNVQEEIKESLVADGYLSKITFFVFPIILTQMLLVVIVVIVNVTMQGYSYDFPISVPFLVACVLLIPLAFRSSRAYTQLGVDTKQQIKGFKDFLSTTDRDRFDFHNAPDSFKSGAIDDELQSFRAPEKSPTQFMEYLPYAIALGVETKWAKQFQDITIPKPDWYVSPHMSSFVISDFVDQIGTVSDTISSAVTPSSSGSGGGGFSGGGSGGGGGGSW
jgi:uncharacterized membrane protein